MFATPQEYLEYLQQISSKDYELPFEKHPEFTKLNDENIASLSADKIEGMHEMKFLIQRYVDAIASTVSPDIAIKIKNSIAFGLARNGSFNATCSKSLNNKYAVLIYEGLFILLSKHGKLAQAANDPKSVMFCNRGNIDNLSTVDYLGFIDELFENYKKYHYPIGALVKIKPEYTHYMLYVMLSELFAICHEIGHFLNGDFEEDVNFASFTDFPFKAFIENANHEIEYKADLTAFPIFEKAALELFAGMSKENLLIPLIMFFDIIGTISKPNSKSHPEPIRRMVNILVKYYSEQLALDYLSSFENEEKAIFFFSRFKPN